MYFAWTLFSCILNSTQIHTQSDLVSFQTYKSILFTSMFWAFPVLGTLYIINHLVLLNLKKNPDYIKLSENMLISWFIIFGIGILWAMVENVVTGSFSSQSTNKETWISILFEAIYYTLKINIPISLILIGYFLASVMYRREKELTQLILETNENKINLEKEQLYPEYFLKAIKALIDTKNLTRGTRAELTLSLSNILSYLLYEKNKPGILKEDELKITQELIDFHNQLNHQHWTLNLHDNRPYGEFIPLSILSQTLSKLTNQTGPYPFINIPLDEDTVPSH